MAGRGYVKLYRDAIDHSVFDDEWLWKLFCWCIMRANFRATLDKGTTIPRGSFTTGRIAAAEQLRTSPSRVYRGFQRLTELGCITTKANSNWTTVTVCNYETYQEADSADRTAGDTASGQPVIQPADTGKETKQLRREELKESNTYPVAQADALLAAWNQTPGAKPIRKLNHKRRAALRTRLAEPDWDWRAALAKFPLRCFSNGDGYVPTFDFFIRPDTVNAILEGNYDWTKNGNSRTLPHVIDCIGDEGGTE